MNLILCGLPACGKTTIGKKLANHLGRSFLETDALIEEDYFKSSGQKLTCRQIALHHSLQAFRSLEKQQIKRLSLNANSIIALGGGAVGDLENSQRISKLGCVIYLKTPSEIVWERLQHREMPIYLSSSPHQDWTVDSLNIKAVFNQLLKERLSHYEKAADMIIETQSMRVEEIVETILKGINHGR